MFMHTQYLIFIKFSNINLMKSQALTYNFNSEFYMLSKILNKRLINNRNIIYFFSKDPFEKFNRKKEPKPDDGQKAKQAEKQKDIKSEKNENSQFDEEHKKTFQMKRSERTATEQQARKGFRKFSSKSNKKETQHANDNTNAAHNFDKERKQEKNHQQQLRRQRQQTQSQPKDQKAEPTLKGFQRFNRIKSHPQKDKSRRSQINKKDVHQSMESKKQESTAEQNKKVEIPKIKIDLQSSNNDDISVLRKPKGSEAKRSKRQNQRSESEHMNTADPHQQQPQPNKLWQQFEQQKQRIKSSYKNELPRYQRLNLIKDTKDKSEQKKSEQKQEEPVDHKKNLTKLVIAGIGLMLLSNNEYFKWNHGKEVDPQYLKQAIQEDRVDETWVQNTQSDLHNEQSIKGKNFESFIYIREKNGDISYCVSNQQFEKVWFSLVEKHNQLVDKKSTEAFPITGPHGPVPQAARKITLRHKQEDKNSSLVGDARSILSMVLLYFFIKSIMQASKGSKGKAGKGMSGLFENQKSHRLKQAIKVTFQDVVGMQKAKDQIVEFIDFLKHPKKYSDLGARIPKGALLTGPPGTGKTMLAKACAGESKVPFFTISGSQFIEMYVGVGAQRVRNLFKEAKQNAPSIIFIDEIDAVGKKRSGMGGGGNDERDTTLNQLLVQMDGFDTNTNVIVFAATNQKQVLDPALTRPGRFDRMVQIDLPDLEGRREIFLVHLKPLILNNNVDIKDYAKRLATLTPGFSGADIKNVCNEAAIIAARNNKQYVSIIDFELATERIIGGVEKRSHLITPETQKTVAYHECGHGVVSWFIQNANPLLKLTIIPRSKGALGFAQYLPNEHQMYTKVKLLDQICVILGGRISQEIFFGKISTGASDDLNKAYQIAKAYVTQYGFGDKLGWIQYGETEYAKEYSKDIQNNIDAQILEIMRVCSERTRAIVHEKKQVIHKLAEKLLELETIDQNIISSILGERPFKMSKQHEEYIREKKRISEETLQTKGEEPRKEATAKIKRSDFVL